MSGNNPKPSFIIIDDDTVYNETLCRALKRINREAFSATNSKQALAITAEKKPDCAILDLCIGDEKGIDLVKPLIEIHPPLKIIVLTGYASLATAVKSIKLGAWNYLSKPAKVNSILKAFGQNNEITNSDIVTSSTVTLKQSEWEHLQRTLVENDGNITKTAEQLGMHRRTLQRKLKKKSPL